MGKRVCLVMPCVGGCARRRCREPHFHHDGLPSKSGEFIYQIPRISSICHGKSWMLMFHEICSRQKRSIRYDLTDFFQYFNTRLSILVGEKYRIEPDTLAKLPTVSNEARPSPHCLRYTSLTADPSFCRWTAARSVYGILRIKLDATCRRSGRSEVSSVRQERRRQHRFCEPSAGLSRGCRSNRVRQHERADGGFGTITDAFARYTEEKCGSMHVSPLPGGSRDEFQ
jgi:hypothetical protein